MRTKARFPAIREQSGHYESFYFKLASPDGDRAAWVRHTVHKRPGEPMVGSVWFTWFDRSAGEPRATKQSFDATEIGVPPDSYIRVGDSVLGAGRARGAVYSVELDASWDLSFSDEHEPFRHLPKDFLYSAALPKTKLLSPYPSATFTGSIDVGDERVEIGGWRGMVGHNWGSEHADRWIWIHGNGFKGRQSGDYFDLGAGRIRLLGRRTPWIANANLYLDGVSHRLAGIGRIRSTEIRERPGRCEFLLRGDDIEVSGVVECDLAQTVAWIYADPVGPEHHSLNSSVAGLELQISRPGEPPETITAAGATYELGVRETDHGIPLQPYADG